MNFKEYLKDNIVYLDGGTGTLLQQKGLRPGEHPERLNITNPDLITEVHRDYFNAGSNVVCANTFGANRLNFSSEELEGIIKAAFENARTAREQSTFAGEKFIALDLGSTGRLLKPLGDLDFEDAVEILGETVKYGEKYGADLVFIETMNDSYETKAAVLAAKENSSLPVIVSNAYGEDGKLMTGASPAAMVAMLEGLGVDALGANCSYGPKQLRPVIEELLENASVPVILKPNAGLPKSVDGQTVFDVEPSEFADEIAELVKKGVRLIGGCCGTTPKYIEALKKKTDALSSVRLTDKNITAVSSYTRCVKFDNDPVLIGERINPTGKKRLKQALAENDLDYILSEAVGQQEKGVHILDVNVGLPEINEAEMLERVICELQAVTDLPLQADTSDITAMEAALRRYNGKAMINSVNGKEESMKAVFPLVKKYGGLVVCLTLDENGIPSTKEGRVKIAKNIIKTAKEYGIDKKDLVFDALTMTVSADKNSAKITLDALKEISEKLRCKTVLGVSNVSFGLPERDNVNSVFFTLAMQNGLSGAIINPYSYEMLNAYHSFKLLNGKDDDCKGYIDFTQNNFKQSALSSLAVTGKNETEYASDLQEAIIKGYKDKSVEITKALLKTKEPLEIVNGDVIPALDKVGKAFEEKRAFLPQLLISAECAKNAFGQIKTALSGSSFTKKAKIVLATVKGDIHDIGKNIVKLLLENYGFDVIDLGKDIPPESVLQAVKTSGAKLVGLSALMTTTVPAMEETIKALKEFFPTVKTVVGGAVLNEDYANKIGADKYCKDAMDTVRFAEELYNEGFFG